MSADPQRTAGLHRAALTALREGRPQEAHQHCLAILQSDRHHADAWFLCGVIAAGNGQHAKAADILRNAITLRPDRAEYHAELGKAQRALGQTRAALATADVALALEPRDLPTLNTLGALLSHCGEHQRALPCFRQAVRTLEARGDPGQLSDDYLLDLYFNLAVSAQFAGCFTEAEAAYERAIALRPAFFKAHAALANLRRQTPGANHLQRLNALRGSVQSAEDQLQLGHALAKELEDLGHYAESFTSLVWAKQAQARRSGYRAQSDAALFTCLRELFGLTALSGSAVTGGCDNPEPIFVVGMPRTGTTLVEQILGSHSRVFAAGELTHFPQQVKRLSGSAVEGNLDIETLQLAANIDKRALGAAYIDSTRPRTGHTPHFVDKLPLNFLYLGLIRQALPRAKLVCLRRDPMDTCLSNYRQLFATNFRFYHYNLDLLDCGRYYLEFDRLMRHWRKAMPGAVFELQYEELVSQPAQSVRALLAHCELPWEESCLDYHRRETSVATPSAVQVRQPIHTGAVGRWRRYGDAVQPLYRLLQEGGCYP